MQQNNQLTNDRLAHVYRNLKLWAEHDNALNSYISGQKIDPIFHDCVVALAELQERRAVDKQTPVAWTDAEELRDLERDGCGAMLSMNRKDCEYADPRRQILLFTHPAPLRNTEWEELQERREADSAEPVAWMCEDEDGREYNSHNEFSCGRFGVPLYAASQPESVLPDEIEPDDGNTFDYVDGWNACRAAMLQAKSANTKGPDHAND